MSQESENSNPKVWLLRAGRHGEDEAAALEHAAAIIGFRPEPDLSSATTPEEILQQVREARPEDRQKTIRSFASQLTAFVLRMKEGDTVVLPLKTSGTVALGRVTGPYLFREFGGEVRHTRSVKWVRTDVPRTEIAQDLLYSLGAARTVCRIKRNDAESRLAVVLSGILSLPSMDLHCFKQRIGRNPIEVKAVQGGSVSEGAEEEIRIRESLHPFRTGEGGATGEHRVTQMKIMDFSPGGAGKGMATDEHR